MSSLTKAVLRLFALVAAAAFASAATAQSGDRVVGGVDAKPGEWPFQAYLLVDTADGQFACGGTLVSPRWVLTAAHCTQSPSGGEFAASAITARLGSVTRSSGGELRKVVRIVRHQAYQANHALENDIALLELDAPASVGPVALEAASGMRTSSETSPWARVLGWGLRTGGDLASSSEILQAAALPVVDVARCDRAMRIKVPKAGAIDARRLCAGQSVGGVDSCNGDSGGPLLVSDGSGWRQVGIVSYGVTECGAANAYGVYTRVGAYADWISRTIGNPGTTGGASVGPPAPLQLGLATSAPTLISIAEQNGDGLQVGVAPRSMTIGLPFRISVTSPVSGYLGLFDIGPQNEVLQVFPNPRAASLNKDGKIEAGRTISIPDPSYGFEFRAAEPKGRGRLLAVVAEDPAEFAKLFSAADGLKSLPDAPSRFARLEIVMKETVQEGAGPAPEPGPDIDPQPVKRRWIAGLADYLIK